MLFGDVQSTAASLDALTSAVAQTTRLAPAAVAVRRVRDTSSPFSTVLLYVNPLYAGDVFATRRRRQEVREQGQLELLSLRPQLRKERKGDQGPQVQHQQAQHTQQLRRRLGASDSVSVDIQLALVDIAAAASLATALAAAPATLADSVLSKLRAGGSAASVALGAATISAVVQPFSASGHAAAPNSSGGGVVAIAAGGASGAVVVVLALCGILIYRNVRRRAAVAAYSEAREAALASSVARAPGEGEAKEHGAMALGDSAGSAR